ncbi:ABC transporter permease [Deferrisoma camini]|uniref:ABC transporter permease n=1 Tax=Deferrisoma camini TaxID=1035120 RepID=UPI00046CA755|nr:FtsX-like permease family protein [Deferrisoma camini]
MTLLKIAFRNVLKNRRRSLITVLAIAFGYMAVAMFKGYTHQAYEKMALAAIFVEVPGHLVVYKKGFLEEGRLRPEDYLFTGEESSRLAETIRKIPGVAWVARRMELTGLLSNGDVSTIFLSDAIDPAKEADLWSHYRYRRWMSRKTLPRDRPDAILVGPDLLTLLRLQPGSNVVLMATTQYGQMNAVDATVAGTYATFSDEMNDKYVKMPLAMAQSLYDTDGCDRLSILCDDVSIVPEVKARVERVAADLGIPVDVRTWEQISQYYGKAKNFLDVVFLFLFSITSLIVVMGTVNTMSMSVYERFREIGTLRAIGFKPWDVIRLFAFEGAVLGTLGAVAGLGLTAAGRVLVTAADIRYKPPGVAELVQVEVDLVPAVLAVGFAVFVALSVLSAALPARRAARKPIVDALGHV